MPIMKDNATNPLIGKLVFKDSFSPVIADAFTHVIKNESVQNMNDLKKRVEALLVDQNKAVALIVAAELLLDMFAKSAVIFEPGTSDAEVKAFADKKKAEGNAVFGYATTQDGELARLDKFPPTKPDYLKPISDAPTSGASPKDGNKNEVELYGEMMRDRMFETKAIEFISEIANMLAESGKEDEVADAGSEVLEVLSQYGRGVQTVAAYTAFLTTLCTMAKAMSQTPALLAVARRTPRQKFLADIVDDTRAAQNLPNIHAVNA